ncbi:MAG TPA: Ig-like domain-containing protein, partial [Polyangiaceae bacterium]|nr:Ig-like domain-containing protein [Polyangiaceae bacterium]
AGPVVAFSSPVDGDVVGGTVRLSFSVTDAISGVDPSSVVVSLNDQQNTYDATSDRWSRSGNNFTFEFDSRQVKNSKVQITVNVGAKDMVGNISPVSAELLYLDNYPPSVDLDPSNVRSVTVSTPVRCSGSFDPVGDDAKNDLGTASIAATFRALIWDNTNTTPEIPQPHFSATNPASVRLYVSDGAKPLLIDKDHDGTCDDVVEVASTDSIDLDPVTASNTPWYRNDPGASPAPVGCALDDVDAKKPDGLCTDKKSPMWQVIQDNYNKIPVIYARGVTSGQECTGVAWEFATKLTKNGWVCFAARATDFVGNVGVSRPLRVCVDNPDFGASPPCAVSSELPPSCTDSCTAPPRVSKGLVEIP